MNCLVMLFVVQLKIEESPVGAVLFQQPHWTFCRKSHLLVCLLLVPPQPRPCLWDILLTDRSRFWPAFVVVHSNTVTTGQLRFSA